MYLFLVISSLLFKSFKEEVKTSTFKYDSILFQLEEGVCYNNKRVFSVKFFCVL